MSPRKKGAILSFVQPGNFEFQSLTGLEPGTFHVTVGSLNHYTKFIYEKCSTNFKSDFKRYLKSFCGRVASRVEKQSAISIEKTKNKHP